MMIQAQAATGGGCAFTLDVQWILDAIDKVKSYVARIEHMMRSVLDKAHRFLEAINGIMEWFCWIPGLGQVLKWTVRQAVQVIEHTVRAVSQTIQSQLELMKHVLAPWEVRSAGKSIVDQLVPKCDAFALQYQRGHFRSAESWTGDASEAFFSAVDKQHETATDVAAGARAFGEAVHEMGAKGVETTVNFITQYIAAAVGIIVSAVEMAAIPVGTALGAAQIMGLVAAIITYIMVWVNAMLSMISSMSAMENAAHQAVPGGQWPRAVV